MKRSEMSENTTLRVCKHSYTQLAAQLLSVEQRTLAENQLREQ